MPAADRAIETGSLDSVTTLLLEAGQQGLQKHFEEVIARKNFDKNDVEAGREYVRAYVEYVHYVEGIYEAITAGADHHAHEAEEHGQ